MTVDLTYDLELQIRAFLLAAPDVFAMVGDRIWPAPAPQNATSPFVTFSRITVERNYTIYGPDRLTGALIQIDCWSDAPEYQGSYRIAKSLGIAVRQALHGFRGMMGPVRIQETDLEGERDIFEAQDHTRRVSFDFRIWYDEDAASGPVPPSYVGPLDKVPGAIFGYSTRLLRAGYGLAANSIQRASDGQNLGIGFAADGSFDTAAADAFLAATTGAVLAWPDQTPNVGGTAVQVTAGNQPGFPKTGGVYGAAWTGHSAQVVAAADNANLAGLFAGNGYLLAVIEPGTVSVDTPAGLLTKGSWSIFFYRGGSDPTPGLWLIQQGATGQGGWGTTPLASATGRHLLEVEYDSRSSTNVPSFTLDGVALALLGSSSGYGGIVNLDTGPLEIGNSSLLAGGLAGFTGRILELVAYKGTVAPADKATLRADLKAFYSTP